MATIGVTRGLGDHNLKVCSSTLPIKPFLSCFPEVSRMGLPQLDLSPSGGPSWFSSRVPLSRSFFSTLFSPPGASVRPDTV